MKKLIIKFVSSRHVAEIVILLAACLVNPATAENFFEENDDILDVAPIASDAELDELRGGFTLPNGVNVDFSIEKIVALNGVITFSSSFRLPETISLIQNGFDRAIPEINGGGLGSIIQNSLDNQVISRINTINIELSNLRNANNNLGNMVFGDMVMPNLYKN